MEAQLQFTANQLALLRLAIEVLKTTLQQQLAQAPQGSEKAQQLWNLLGDASTATGRIDRAAMHLKRRSDAANIEDLKKRLAEAQAQAEEDSADGA